MGNKKSLLRERYTKVSTGAAYDDIKSDAPDPGEVWCVQNLSVENLTTNYTELRLFIEGRGYNHHIEEQDNPLAAHLFTHDRDVYIHEHEKLVARLTGCTSADKLEMHLSGYIQEVKTNA